MSTSSANRKYVLICDDRVRLVESACSASWRTSAAASNMHRDTRGGWTHLLVVLPGGLHKDVGRDMNPDRNDIVVVAGFREAVPHAVLPQT